MNRSIFTIFSHDHSTHQIFWVDYDGEQLQKITPSLRNRISDSVDQELFVGITDNFIAAFSKLTPVELVTFKPGVTDNPAKSFLELVIRDENFKGRKVSVHSGLLKAQGGLDFNPLIQMRMRFAAAADFKALGDIDFNVGLHAEIKVQEYDLLTMNDEGLVKLSTENCWALSLTEMKAIQEHFKKLGRKPTDVEIELLAQTWSEHCKHKIFGANIHYQDSEQKFTVNGLFKTFIKNPTYALAKPWTVSVFDDNAGIVRFRDGIDLCIKVETHNSPSALDPYGGALTGILGVNRDIMGTGLGAKPVANTDVFCVGMPDETGLPEALLHPKEILKGIHRGVQDGGNKSGIPTVNGAIYFDESYSGKPLVYCGTVGVLPPKIQERDTSKKMQVPGDYIVMVGGAVGIDGIHGATASSLVMDKNTTLGMVQIGDPFGQKRVLDFLLAARDKLLYSSLTDNGAGGLSSSVGEMALGTNGATLNLEAVPLKYPGLLPWQILVSESQERMTLSVPAKNWKELEELAALYQVSAVRVGEFTSSGKFICNYQGKKVCELELAFLHDGCPKLELKARFEGSYKSWKPKPKGVTKLNNHKEITQKLLSHPSIASKEKWVRQYDHEVQGATVVKPFEGMKSISPNDAGVLWYGAYGVDGYEGFGVASGLCPHFSIDDTYLMTEMAVDEAVRNLICHGADPEKIALLDNFCWPDPIASAKNPDGEFKLAQLVRSCMALKSMMETYRMPLVSGKDSMKNDYHGKKVKISVLPTLLVTALGHVPDVRNVPKSCAEAGDLLYRVGKPDYEKYFGHFLHCVADIPRTNERKFDWGETRKLYQNLFTATQKNLISGMHDISEGGFIVAMAEMLMLNQLGVRFAINPKANETAYLYSELPGHFVVAVKKENRVAFEALIEAEYLGEATKTGKIEFGSEALSINELTRAWRQL